MFLTRSWLSKALVTAAAALCFVWLLEVTIFDARHGAAPLAFFDRGFDGTAPPQPGSRLLFTATAYCKGAVTSSGAPAREGVSAADPALLPLGSIVELDFSDDAYDGIYSVLDTGPEVRGREIDLYIWSCNEALVFGRRSVRMTVLRLGWNPQATTPGFMDWLFRHLPGERRAPRRRPEPPAPPSSDDSAGTTGAARQPEAPILGPPADIGVVLPPVGD